MSKNKYIEQIKEVFLNSWSSKNYYFLNGWILRFSDGITDRANSVLSYNYIGDKNTIKRDIHIVEESYKEVGLTPKFMMHREYKPNYLYERLIEYGYVSYSFTHVMWAKIDNLLLFPIKPDLNFKFYDYRSKEFSSLFIKNGLHSLKEERLIREINNHIILPKKCYYVGLLNNRPVVTVLGILDLLKNLYLADILVDENFRGKGFAKSAITWIIQNWALKSEVKMVWLQVEQQNQNAVSLYKKLNMEILYDYFYMKKEN